MFYVISINYGLPPLYSGYTIGYPTIFYYSEKGVDALHGFNKIELIYNILIFLVLTFLTYKVSNIKR